MTPKEADAAQQWAGMDGATAWHLIDRHADGWDEVGEMMNAWLRANGGSLATRMGQMIGETMKTHDGCKRGFTHLSASWYGKSCLARADYVDHVMIGFYHPEGGTAGEFSIRWMILSGKVTPRLEAFDDAWHALYEFRDVLAKLAEHDGEDMSPEAICSLLIECGVEDMTQRREETT